MLLVSPIVALATIIILAGWFYFTRGNARISWWMVISVVVVFIVGLFLLSSALDRKGNLGGGSPIGIINNFMREAVKWDVYQLERSSGWVQKLFDEMHDWMHLPFVTVYGIFQPVLPAAFFEPTKLIWRIIAILRAVGWYTMLPALILSLGVAAGQSAVLKTTLIMVMGHESCGAVKAAVEAVDTHKDFPGHIQLMASAIAPAVRAVNDTSSSRLVNVTKANVIQQR